MAQRGRPPRPALPTHSPELRAELDQVEARLAEKLAALEAAERAARATADEARAALRKYVSGLPRADAARRLGISTTNLPGYLQAGKRSPGVVRILQLTRRALRDLNKKKFSSDS